MSENKKYTSKNPLVQKCLDILDLADTTVNWTDMSGSGGFYFKVFFRGKRVFEVTQHCLYVGDSQYNYADEIDGFSFEDVKTVLYPRLYSEHADRVKSMAGSLDFLNKETDIKVSEENAIKAPASLSFRDRVRAFFARGRARQ